MVALTCQNTVRAFLFFKKKVNTLRLLDRDGVIRLQRKNATVVSCPVKRWKSVVQNVLADNTIHGDGGAEIPNLYVVLGRRIIDLAGMQSESQIMSLCRVELSGARPDDSLIVICTRTTENERG
jgi:hypothetical protein